MIRLEVQPYCESCLDFEPDVIRPVKAMSFTDEEILISDTIIRCEHAKRCENIRRYLQQQSTKEG